MTKRNISPKLKNKYRFIIYNDTSFAEIFSLRLSLLNTYVIVSGGILLCLIIGLLLVLFTPLRQFIAPNEYAVKSKLYQNTLKIDSLENILLAQDLQYKRVQLLLAGKEDLLLKEDKKNAFTAVPFSQNKKELKHIRAKADSILRAEFESENRFNVTQGQTTKKGEVFNLYLYPPVKNGIINISNKGVYNQHIGVDIRAKAHSHVMATAEGTVINADWSLEDGYTLVIQHDNNLISSYKYNAELLKKVGDKVKRGEAIAILGNADKKAVSPYLHFELWHKGVSLNPKDFISF